MRRSQFVARGGMLTAVSLALLYLASVMPTGQAGVCAAAGIVPAMPLSRGRFSLAFSVYGAVLLLGWLLVPLKGVMLGYTAFGLYSFVKYGAERLRHRVPEWLLKLLFCNACLIALAALLSWGFLPDATLAERGLLLPAWLFMNLVFVAFDIAFSKLIGILRRIFSDK